MPISLNSQQVAEDHINDPLGVALSDYLKQPSEAVVIVHSDITDEEVLVVSHFFRDEHSLSLLEKTALDRCRGRVLDIGAGAGSHALMLQARGLSVTAIDISAGAVRVMQQRGVTDARCMNITDFEGETFDTLLLLMNGIGVAGTLDGLMALLEQSRQWLKPGGQILLDSVDIFYMYEDEEGGYWIDLNGPYHGEVTYQMVYKNITSDPFPWLFIGFDVLSDCAQAAGFLCEVLYTDENEQYLARLTMQ